MSELHLPHDPSTEIVTISATLRSSAARQHTLVLEHHDFFTPAHAAVWSAIKALEQESSPIDATMVAGKLHGSNQLASVGGAEFVYSIRRAEYTEESVEGYVKTLQDLSARRRLLSALNNSIATVTTESDPLTAYTEVIARIDASVPESGAIDGQEASFLVEASMARVRSRQVPSLGDLTYTSGLHCWDECLGGLIGGRVNIIAGRPGHGKTAMASSVVLHAAQQGARCLFFSLEMTKEDLLDRFMAMESKVPLTKILRGNLTTEDVAQIEKDQELWAPPNLIIDDTSALTVADMVTRTKLYAKRLGGIPDVIVVDYVQLVAADRDLPKNRSRYDELSAIAKGIADRLAKSTGACVLLLSQLSRGVERREDKRPVMSDLNESGQLEAIAASITFPYATWRHSKDKEGMGHDTKGGNRAYGMELIVAKNRFGPTRDGEENDVAFVAEITKVCDWKSAGLIDPSKVGNF